MPEILEKNRPRARASDPETSKVAASKAKTTVKRLNILRFLMAYREGASFQIAQRLKKNRDSISPQLSTMASLGLIRKTGRTIINEYTGNQCETWELNSGNAELEKIRPIIENYRLSSEHVCVCRTCGKSW